MMQQNVRCLIQGCADHLVTATTDAAVIVSLTRTVAFRGKAKMRSNISKPIGRSVRVQPAIGRDAVNDDRVIAKNAPEKLDWVLNALM